MLCVMVNGVDRSNRFPPRRVFFSGVEISIETREITAADLQPNFVSPAKNVARGPQVDGELISLARIHESGLLLGIPVARTKNSLRQILRKAIRPHVHQFGDEVSVYG